MSKLVTQMSRRGSGGGAGALGLNLDAPHAQPGTFPQGGPSMLRSRSSDMFKPVKQPAQEEAQPANKKKGFFKEKAFWNKRRKRGASRAQDEQRLQKKKSTWRSKIKGKGKGSQRALSPNPSPKGGPPRGKLKSSSSRMLFDRDDRSMQKKRSVRFEDDDDDTDLGTDDDMDMGADPLAAWQGLIGAGAPTAANKSPSGSMRGVGGGQVRKKDPRKYAESSRVLGGARRAPGKYVPQQQQHRQPTAGSSRRMRPNAQPAPRAKPRADTGGAGRQIGGRGGALGVTQDVTQRPSFLAMMNEQAPGQVAFPTTAGKKKGIQTSHEYHPQSLNKLKKQNTRKKLVTRALDDNALPAEIRPVLKASPSGKRVVMRLDVLAMRFDEMPNPLSLWDKVIGKAKKFTSNVEDVYRLMHTLAVRRTDWQDTEEMRMLMLKDADLVGKQFKRGKKFVIKRDEFPTRFPEALRVVHEVQNVQADNFSMRF